MDGDPGENITCLAEVMILLCTVYEMCQPLDASAIWVIEFHHWHVICLVSTCLISHTLSLPVPQASGRVMRYSLCVTGTSTLYFTVVACVDNCLSCDLNIRRCDPGKCRPGHGVNHVSGRCSGNDLLYNKYADKNI